MKNRSFQIILLIQSDLRRITKYEYYKYNIFCFKQWHNKQTNKRGLFNKYWTFI